MLPVWIINLATDRADRESFRRLRSALTPRQQSYWYYSEMESEPVTDLASCGALLKELVDKGRNCYNYFQKEGFVISDFQICIMGATGERLSRTSFHLIPSLLRDFMSSIWGAYVQRGVVITGMLFIPDNFNQFSMAERNECTLFLEELNTLVAALKTDHYNRVVVYQDIQRPDVRFYPKLNREQTVELSFQYLLNMYYTGRNRHKVFDSLAQSGFYSLGAASVYYDSLEHKEQAARLLLEKLIETMKDPANVSDRDAEDMIAAKFPKTTLAAENILERLQEGCQGLNVDLKDLEMAPDPHPVDGFYKPKLYLSYYFDYLRFQPARALEFTRVYSHLLTRKLFDRIAKNKNDASLRFREIIARYNRTLAEGDYKFPTIPQLKAALTGLKERLEKEREQVGQLSGRSERKVFEVPAYLSAYYSDCKANRSACSAKELAENMKNALKSEPSVMGLINRCCLLGTVMSFVLIPLLRELSPFIINLGDVAGYEYLWIAVIFILPFLYQFGIRLRRHFLFVRKQKHLLLAQALVGVQEKASAKVYLQASEFFAGLVEECEKALKRCDAIEENLHPSATETSPPDVPRTLFNQPLIGGAFQGVRILPELSAVGDELTVGGKTVKLSDIGTNERLKLLKELFKTPDACPLNVSEKSPGAEETPQMLNDWVNACMERMKTALYGRMKINEEQNIGNVVNDMLRKDESLIDLKPLFRMAEVNGIITHSADARGLVIRSYIKPDRLPKEASRAEYNSADETVKPYLFVTAWSRPEINRLNTRGLCDMELKQIADPLPFTTQLTCLYAHYRKGDSSCRVGEVRIPVATGQLKELENHINCMRS
ncbi:MAG: hypothetical protein LBT76_03990 [Tannerella sp.]|jgi:hypothetical protein|nr:hypothetical protein [Tannerella sp.]